MGFFFPRNTWQHLHTTDYSPNLAVKLGAYFPCGSSAIKYSTEKCYWQITNMQRTSTQGPTMQLHTNPRVWVIFCPKSLKKKKKARSTLEWHSQLRILHWCIPVWVITAWKTKPNSTPALRSPPKKANCLSHLCSYFGDHHFSEFIKSKFVISHSTI